MKFDTVIIGGGLSGMVCGIRLLEAGRSCAIISQGQSALHFSSGSFDLLGTMPDGTETDDPISGIKALEKISGSHPYAVIGMELCEKYAEETPVHAAFRRYTRSGQLPQKPLQNHSHGQVKTYMAYHGRLSDFRTV